MCLLTDQLDAKKAKRPIVCFKTARLIIDTESFNKHTQHQVEDAKCSVSDPVLRSMYYGFQYRLNQPYRCETFKTYTTTKFVNDGFHSYRDELRAEQACDVGDEVVLKCRIPRGAMYFEGDVPHQYCSDSIEVLGWRFRHEPAGRWHFKGGSLIETRRTLSDIVRKLFKKKEED